MIVYSVEIRLASESDLMGKIQSALTLRKIMEKLGNRYRSEVLEVRDTQCSMKVLCDSDAELRDYLDQTLQEITSLSFHVEITEVGGSLADTPSVKKEGNASDDDMPPRQETEDASQHNTVLDRIRALVGAEEFKALCEELVRMAPAIKNMKGSGYLTRNSYLFSIDDGYGLSHALKLFAELLNEQGLIESPRCSEFAMPDTDDPSELKQLENQLCGELLPKREGGMLCLDLSQCQSSLSKPGYRQVLRAIASANESVLIFRLPYMEQRAMKNIVDILDDIFFLRQVTFIPMDFEDLSVCAHRAAKEYGFRLRSDVEPILAQLVAAEKSDGRFYGVKTVQKLVDRIVYEKLRCAPDSGSEISASDLQSLDNNSELQNLPAMEQLKQLIGMESVAEQLEAIVSLIEFAIKNKSSTRPSIHMRFVGNPGTGKTTVARILGQLLKERGILRKGVFFEYAGEDFKAKYVGHTAPKTAQICRDAYGSVLFIDEAYALAVDENGGGTASYSAEALNTLLAEMENHRDDMVVIMAGYKDEIDKLMQSNPGLVQRMPYEIVFPNYTREQLADIFFAQARKDFMFGEEFIETVRNYFHTLPNNIYLSPNFANARFVRNLFERTWSKAVMRAQLEHAALTTLMPSDFRDAAEEMQASATGAMIFGKDKSGAVMFAEENSSISFADVCGEDEAKELLQEMVDFLKHPARYHAMGAHIPHGALLYGPPGTGKTMLAKAVAGESGVPFLSVSGSDLSSQYVNGGAENIRNLFSKARKLSPCIIFIDEIDAIGTSRSGRSGSDTTLIQLLTEMDGFDDKSEVIVLAATNHPENLDAALRRPGRFDREVPVELPDLEGRVSILNHYLQGVPHDAGIDVNAVARMAAGCSGAELRNIVNEAALMALREQREYVIQHDLEESIDIISVGYLKKNNIMSEHEKWVTCYHEIGHALVTALQTHTSPLQKITVLPRTSGVLGFSQQLETRDAVMHTREEIEQQIAICCAGRAAEEVHFNAVTTGASNDIEKATRMARSIVARYGMTDEFDMVCLERTSGGYLGGGVSQNCSDATAQAVDAKVIEIVRNQHRNALDMLRAHEDKLDALARFLFEKETITGEEFMAILNS